MVNDNVAPQRQADAGPSTTPNWDADLFRSSFIRPMESTSNGSSTGSGSSDGGGKLRPNEGGGKIQDNPGTVPPAPSAPSTETGTDSGAGRYKPTEPDFSDAYQRLRERLQGGGKLNEGGGKLKPIEGGGGKLKPVEGGGKINPFDGGDGGKLNPNEGGDGGKLNPNDGGGKLNENDGSGNDRVEGNPLNEAEKSAIKGDYNGLKKALEKAFENSGIDSKRFKEFGQKLADQLKDDGFTVKAGEGKIAIHRDGDPLAVEFKMDAELDFNTGKIKAEAKPQTYDWNTKKDVDGDPAAVIKGSRGQSDKTIQPQAEADLREEAYREDTTGKNGNNVKPTNLDNRLNRLMRPSPFDQRRHQQQQQRK